jgi:DNA-binding NarL/FixJ family response regulator
MKLRIVIADDNLGVLLQFASILQNEFDVVAAVPDGGLALEAIRSLRPDVAVLDLRMPVLDGIQLAKRLKEESHCPAVVICSVEEDQEFVEAAQHAGALGYVFKSRIARDLLDAIRSVTQGRSFVSLR